MKLFVFALTMALRVWCCSARADDGVFHEIWPLGICLEILFKLVSSVFFGAAIFAVSQPS